MLLIFELLNLHFARYNGTVIFVTCARPKKLPGPIRSYKPVLFSTSDTASPAVNGTIPHDITVTSSRHITTAATIRLQAIVVIVEDRRRSTKRQSYSDLMRTPAG